MLTLKSLCNWCCRSTDTANLNMKSQDLQRQMLRHRWNFNASVAEVYICVCVFVINSTPKFFGI